MHFYTEKYFGGPDLVAFHMLCSFELVLLDGTAVTVTVVLRAMPYQTYCSLASGNCEVV